MKPLLSHRCCRRFARFLENLKLRFRACGEQNFDRSQRASSRAQRESVPDASKAESHNEIASECRPARCKKNKPEPLWFRLEAQFDLSIWCLSQFKFFRLTSATSERPHPESSQTEQDDRGGFGNRVRITTGIDTAGIIHV